MNLSEFKAWFEGFTENISGQPSKKQWARIQERVGEITSEPTSYPVFVDRYVRPYQPWWGTYTLRYQSSSTAPTYSGETLTNNTTAFVNAGRAEAAQVSYTSNG